MPTRVRTDVALTQRSWIRKAASGYASVQPATWNTAQSRASWSGASEPRRQYGPSVCSRIQAMSQGGVCSSRSSHSSRQRSPRNGGWGGMAFMPSWLTAYWHFSLAVTQPPRMWTSSR